MIPKQFDNPTKTLKGGKAMSFVGTYNHSLDSKKRVFVPSKFREELGGEFYITRKADPYLSIYTAREWEEFVKKIESLPESVAAPLQDFLIGGAQRCTPDGNGRIVLENRLIKHAEITKNIVFVGTGNQIRIWAEEKWIERETTLNPENMKEIMRQFGL
jgi:MraZ protein